MYKNAYRKDFPILNEKINRRRFAYLDSAASSLKPASVIEGMTEVYEKHYSNIHRGVYFTSQKTTEKYDEAREKVREFINALSEKEIIFTRGTTEAINMTASAWGEKNINSYDTILLTKAEHHSNLVPWQQLAKRKGAKLEYVNITKEGDLDYEDFLNKISHKPKLFAVTLMSNALGNTYPVTQMIKEAHRNNVHVLVDAAQEIPHFPVDVQDMDCDFLAFSGHKMLGPTGIGVLYGKKDILEKMTPYQYGGDMILSVKLHETLFNELPCKLEAGTPPVVEAIGLGLAIDYIKKLGWTKIRKIEDQLTSRTLSLLNKMPDIELYGKRDMENRGGIISFNLKGIHPHDVGTILDEGGVAVRAGHHCAQPLMEELKQTATIRASFYIYNDLEDVMQLIEGIENTRRIFHVERPSLNAV
tara:strand:- start:12498 stop:13745 length:1248 start_codon:yes stop_codon:yes gene_type:complete